MPTETAPAEKTILEPAFDEQPIDNTHHYASQYLNLTLVMVPTDDVPVDNKGGTRRVPGKKIEFREGRYSTTDEHEIKFLDEHENKDRLFRDVTADMPKPDSIEALEQVTKATAMRDRETIEAILRRELKEHKREDVMRACEAALEALDVVNSTPAEKPAK
jgi:hypothetical protein